MEKFDFAKKVLQISIEDENWDGTDVAKLLKVLAACVDRDNSKRAVGRLVRTLPIELLDAEFVAGMSACSMKFDLESFVHVFRGKPDRLVKFLREAVTQGVVNLKRDSSLSQMVRAILDSETSVDVQIDTVIRFCELLDSKSTCGKLVGEVCKHIEFEYARKLACQVMRCTYFDDLRGSTDGYLRQLESRAGEELVEAVKRDCDGSESEVSSDSDVDEYGGFVSYGGESDIEDSGNGTKRSVEESFVARKHRKPSLSSSGDEKSDCNGSESPFSGNESPDASRQRQYNSHSESEDDGDLSGQHARRPASDDDSICNASDEENF